MRNRPTTRRFAAALLLWLGLAVQAHIDAPRISLTQLFMAADLVAIARVDSVEMRSFAEAGEEGKEMRYEVVTASVSDQYKGEFGQQIEFFQYAHGHAFYRAGDRAVLFLQALGPEHQLSAIGRIGDIHYVSHQVRSTEHRLTESEMADYRWVLQSYADLAASKEPDTGLETVSGILLRMLQSDSPALMESALLDWSAAGPGIAFGDADIAGLERVVRDTTKPVGLRLALLRELNRRGRSDGTVWVWLLANESDDNLSIVLAALQNYENIQLREPLLAMLDGSSPQVTEGAARALGHPVYLGAEQPLHRLLLSDDQRLSYAAVQGLAGIDSPRSRAMLAEAAERHPNPRVRRMISARLKQALTAVAGSNLGHRP